DEGSYLRYRRMAKNTPGRVNNADKVPVKLKLLDEQIFSHPGQMDFVDNAIDTASGTIRARAVFPNPAGTLTPGMFGRIQVATGPPAEALLVPDLAIGTEQVRKYVLVVDDNNVAQPKYVAGGAVDGGAAGGGAGPGARGPRNRRRLDGGAAGPQGPAGDAPRRSRDRARAGASALIRQAGDAHLAFLHRPADLRRRCL